MFAKIHGAEIYFDVDGAGLRPAATTMETCPTMFVLHGGPGGDHSSFKTQAVAQLRDVAQLVYVDHRGAGRSRSPDPETEDLEHNIEDLEGLRQYLGLAQVSLLGSSYGGMVAQGYAVRYPDRVANLILVATAPSYRFLADAQRIVDLSQTRAASEEFGDLEVAEQDIAPVINQQDAVGHLLERMLQQIAGTAALIEQLLQVQRPGEMPPEQVSSLDFARGVFACLRGAARAHGKPALSASGDDPAHRTANSQGLQTQLVVIILCQCSERDDIVRKHYFPCDELISSGGQ